MSGFHHEAIFYSGDDEYLAAMLPELRAALARDGTVMVAVAEDKAALLRGALGEDAERVSFADMARLGRNPACIIPAWYEFLAAAGDGPVLGVGEPVWPGRSADELIECRRHEALLNLAFDGGSDWRLLCPYDVEGLDRVALADARCNHPHVNEHGASRPSGNYVEPMRMLAWDGALDPPAGAPAELGFTRADLARVRRFVQDRAAAAGIDRLRRADLVLAVNELATNSMRHGGGSGRLRVWRDGGTLLCEVSDQGHIGNPLAGRERAPDADGGGRGLWLVNQLCDLVQVRSSRAGNVVRLHMSL